MITRRDIPNIHAAVFEDPDEVDPLERHERMASLMRAAATWIAEQAELATIILGMELDNDNDTPPLVTVYYCRI